ncbi:long chain acyl-CoA synthetase 6, peroxisomal-like isoform X2 [Mangifera indica]|uniref:long chain acyl-CoA synthetase 6, peroxisomal-like isoform X2 n=1 Tax=Mangifera indica TaxID=29780 RepID=UPI001CFB8AAC|nr:long chain acyl-CoA synthetase 6, peroxisomal-like isoform X2 [Mangifera indica]
MDHSAAAQRRIKAIQAHLISSVDSASQLCHNLTAGEFVYEQGYSVVLPERLHTGKWNVYRSAHSPLKLVSRFTEHPKIATLHDNFVHAVNTFRDNRYLGTRVRGDGTVGEYKWMTYGEAGNARTALGSGLIYHGIPKLLSYLAEIPTVHLVVVVGGMDDQIPSLPSSTGVQVVTHTKLLSQGCSNLQPFSPPNPDDVATICYTSGTTGTPKGAVLTHANLIANVAGGTVATKCSPSDVYISYLPLAHIYERANQVMVVYFGASVGFYQGDSMKLMDDLAALRPTVFCSVPRLYNRIYASITNAVKTSGVLKERLFNAAYNSKKQALLSGKNPSPIWDKLVFNKIRDKLGGRVRLMVSGASPLSPDVMDFLKICFGGRVSEGYGMTETSCLISAVDEGDNLSGHVGSPSPACEIKLVDVPEMNYTSDDQPYPRGEICVRGPIVFKGYYKDEAQTKEVIDEGGWLHTGDIGLWLPGGRLKIIDRKKNIFKLAQGEYIAPEKIENVYAKCKFVAQCFVYGDSLNSSLVAIVSVDQDVLKAWAASEGIKYKDLGQLCNDPRTKAAVLADMDAIGREAQLRGFEFVKAVTLVHEPFTLENGLVTPTFKIKRPQAKQYFAKAISDMYAQLVIADDSSPRTKL